MAKSKYDIFISYKRKSLPTANNLYYRLTTRGYSTFFDLEELGKDNFNTQLFEFIENAKDIFVILEEGSLDACKNADWETDWFCREIAYALERGKNIIPILLNGYKMPPKEFFPRKLQDFHLKQAPEFSFSFFEAYLDKLIEKEYILSKPNARDKATSIFKFYSNENCQVFKEGKLVCSLEGRSDEPYYLPVSRKGDFRFKAVNDKTKESKTINEEIDAVEEKNVEIIWKHSPQIWINNLFRNNRRRLSIVLILIIILVFAYFSFHLWNKVSPQTQEDITVPDTTLTSDSPTPQPEPVNILALKATTPIKDNKTYSFTGYFIGEEPTEPYHYELCLGKKKIKSSIDGTFKNISPIDGGMYILHLVNDAMGKDLTSSITVRGFNNMSLTNTIPPLPANKPLIIFDDFQKRMLDRNDKTLLGYKNKKRSFVAENFKIVLINSNKEIDGEFEASDIQDIRDMIYIYCKWKSARVVELVYNEKGYVTTAIIEPIY